MRRFAGSNTSALLHKASVQLGGGRVVSSVSGTTSTADDDGLADYLQSLNKKSSKPTLQWDKFDELSDLSADDTQQPDKPATAANSNTSNKFIKKKTETQSRDASNTAAAARHSSSALGNARARSSALGKADSLAARFRSARESQPSHVSSDSDAECSLSVDEDVLADVHAAAAATQPTAHSNAVESCIQSKPSLTRSGIKPAGDVESSSLRRTNKPSTSTSSSPAVSALRHSTPVTQSSPHRAALAAVSDDDSSDRSSVGVGKTGNKFIKKRIDSAPGEISSAPDSRLAAAATKPHSKLSPSAAVSDKLGQTVTSVLDSDDESLAEFIGQLSPSHKPAGARSTANQQQQQRTLQSLAAVTHDDDDDDDDDDVVSSSDEVQATVSDADSDNFHLNVYAVDALDYDVDAETSPAAHHHDNDDDDDDDVRRRVRALQTADELLDSVCTPGAGTVDTELLKLVVPTDLDSSVPSTPVPSTPAPAATPLSATHATAATLRSILSTTPRSLTPGSTRSRVRLVDQHNEVRSRSRSASPVLTGRSRSVTSVVDEEDEVMTARSVTSAADSVSSSELTYISDRSRSGRRRSSASSRGHRRMSESAMYSDDFTSARSWVDSSEQSSSVSDEKQQQPQQRQQRRRSSDSHYRRVKSTSVQTGLDVGGLQYSWPHSTTEAVSGVQYGLAFVDPSSIAATVVSPDALEAVTSYSPCSLAINDLLRQQLNMTRQFITVQRRLHHSLISALHSPPAAAESYHYTTLNNTRQFIRTNRRPVLTFDDALRDVKQEMGLV